MSRPAQATEGTGPLHRLFFALWPLPGQLEGLVERVRQLTPAGVGKPQRPDQLHITLEFLGGVPESRLADVRAIGEAAAAEAGPFEVVFDALDHWKRPQVLCLTARVTPEPLARLVQALRRELLARRFDPERREFRAHLTLARNVLRRPELPRFEPLGWPATELTLVESRTGPGGSQYERPVAWPFGR